MKDVYEILSEIVGSELGAAIAPIGPETQLDDIAGWDSVTLAGVMLAIEARFGVAASRRRVDQISTGADLARLCEAPA